MESYPKTSTLQLNVRKRESCTFSYMLTKTTQVIKLLANVTVNHKKCG